MKKWALGAAALGVVVVSGYLGVRTVANAKAQAQVEKAASQIRKHVKQFDYASVDVSPLSQAVEIHDVRLDDGMGRSFNIGAIRLEQFDWTSGDSPRYGHVRLSGVRVSLDEAAVSSLKDYGYDHVEAQAEFGYAFDEVAHTLEVVARLEATNMGVITSRTKVGGVNPGLVMSAMRDINNPMAMGLAALSVTLVEASAEFEDRSLFDKTIGAQAKQRGVPVDQVRAELIQAVALPKAKGNGNDPLAAQAVQAVRDFIEKPGKIKVAAAPKRPVSYAEIVALQMTAADTLFKRLNVHVEKE
jgi:hypothetical protein